MPRREVKTDPEMSAEDARRVLAAYRIGRAYIYQAMRLLDDEGVSRRELAELAGTTPASVGTMVNRQKAGKVRIDGAV